MLQLLARYKGIVVVGLLLLTPLMLLYAQTKRPGARGPVVGVIVDVAAGLERAMLWATGGILDGLEHYVTSVGSWSELVALRRERGLALAWWARAEELEHENDELRALARAVAPIDGPRPLGARVVGRTGAPVSSLITIDVGSADGVRRGDGVIDKAGVVGVVLAVGRRASDVLLLSDSRSAVDVVVQRTRARGILRGSGSEDHYGVSVDDFDKLRDVKPGDAVVTSGLGARFPPGLLVGTVLETSAPDDSLYVEAELRPATSFDRVEHVQVLIDRPPPRAPRLGEEPMLDEVDGGPVDAGPAPAAPRPKPAVALPASAAVDAGPVAAPPAALDAGPTAALPTPGPAAPPAPVAAPPANAGARDGGTP
ncbi:MAG: rod shape-determining protein MreC [Deltaproteobacteria bacterium]|nr:rod shape-determining protein MreC [Deltaproteobacteria bacterium]